MAFPKQYKIFYSLYIAVYGSIGVVMGAIGIASLITILSYGSLVESAFIAAPVIFLVAGVLKVALSIFGIFPVIFRKKFLFAIFVIGSIVLMMLTFVSAIVGFLSRPSAHSGIEAQLVTGYNSQNGSSILNDVISLQDSLNCCGPTRAFNNTIDNCISTRASLSLSGQGCLQYLSDAVLDSLYNIGAVSMGFACFELTAFLVTIQHTEGSGL